MNLKEFLEKKFNIIIEPDDDLLEDEFILMTDKSLVFGRCKKEEEY